MTNTLHQKALDAIQAVRIGKATDDEAARAWDAWADYAEDWQLCLDCEEPSQSTAYCDNCTG